MPIYIAFKLVIGNLHVFILLIESLRGFKISQVGIFHLFHSITNASLVDVVEGLQVNEADHVNDVTDSYLMKMIYSTLPRLVGLFTKQKYLQVNA